MNIWQLYQNIWQYITLYWIYQEYILIILSYIHILKNILINSVEYIFNIFLCIMIYQYIFIISKDIDNIIIYRYMNILNWYTMEVNTIYSLYIFCQIISIFRLNILYTYLYIVKWIYVWYIHIIFNIYWDYHIQDSIRKYIKIYSE